MTTDTFRNVEGRTVIAADSAESIGSVKGFVLDTAGRTIEAIHVDGHGKHAIVLAWPAVQAFGADAVMATNGGGLSIVDDAHQRSAVKGVVSMVGTRVLSVEGRELGTIADVEFDTGSGAVVRVATDQGQIEANRVHSLGSYALVVDEAAPDAASTQP